MKKFSIKELSRIESEIDTEINFVSGRQRSTMNTRQASRQEALDVANKSIASSLTKLNGLLDAKFAIRTIKQVFNAEKGINDKTRDIAKLTAEQAFIDSVASYSEVTASERYASTKVEYSPGITQEKQDELRAKSRVIQRQIQRLKDSCQGINNQGTILLDETTYSTLVSSGLIDA